MRMCIICVGGDGVCWWRECEQLATESRLWACERRGEGERVTQATKLY